MVVVSQVGWLCASTVALEFGCEWWAGLSQHFLLLVILMAVDCGNPNKQNRGLEY